MTASILRKDTIGPFVIFAALYYACILLEMVEHWEYPAATSLMLVLAAAALLHVSRISYLVFLLVSTGYFLLFRFPEVANHVNLAIFVNIGMIGVTLWSLLRRPADDLDAFYDSIVPIARLSIIATFTVAGFHKLNEDFVDPVSSCIGFFSSTIARTMAVDFLGIGVPTGAAVGGIVAVAGYAFWREHRRDFTFPPIDWKAVFLPLGAILLMATVLIVTVGGNVFASPRDTAVFFVAAFVLCWQLVEGPLLFFRRFQWVALSLSLLVHAQLAMIRIVDFQSIALALLATFVPLGMWKVWRRQADIPLGPLRLHRLHLYLGLNIVLGGGLMLVHNHTAAHVEYRWIVSGLLFNTSVLIMIWPFVSGLFSKARNWRWEGVSVIGRSTPAPAFLVPACLVLFGLTSHLGLRTAGNFSMFSNLRTEGDLSNHLILRGNPLKVFGYQDDLVSIVEIDDAAARIGHHYAPLEGRSLPHVEFRKLLYEWQRHGRAVPVTLTYGGETRTYEDVNAAPEWRVAERDLAMYLLDFRVVQPDRPNICRW